MLSRGLISRLRSLSIASKSTSSSTTHFRKFSSEPLGIVELDDGGPPIIEAAPRAMGPQSRRTGAVAVKCGMTALWDKWGARVPITVLWLDDNIVTQVKTMDKEGITALQVWRAALTELVATAALMFTLTASIISCLNSNEPDPKLLIPFVVFAIVFLFLMTTVPLSGGHMSPVFSFIATLRGLISPTRAAIYVLAQCLGSIMGFIIIKSVMSHEVAMKYSLGGCTIVGTGAAPGLGPASALTLEFSCTFVVLFVGVTVAFDPRRCEEHGLTIVCMVVAGAMGLVVFVSTTVTGQPGYAGVALNPARCLGPALLQGGPLWDGHWVFWVGPFIACIVYYGYCKNMPTERLVIGKEYDFVHSIRVVSGRMQSQQATKL